MCISPIELKKETVTQKLKDNYHTQQVPCGRCLECMQDRLNSWFVRLLSELDHCYSAHFVTFTYANSPVTEDGEETLNYKDVQKFFKRLRHSQERKIKYFCVGEYGEKTGRPHYHAIIFNVEDVNQFQKCWKHGHVHVGTVQEESIYYTLKYTLKRGVKWGKKDSITRYQEKALMSKGLGLGYLTENMIRYFKSDVSRPITLKDNKKLPLPRYYRDKIFTYSEKLRRSKLIITDEYINEKAEERANPLFATQVSELYRRKLRILRKSD